MFVKRRKTIIHFVTWYPSKNNHVTGIFTKRQIQLISDNVLYQHIIVKKEEQKAPLLKHVLFLLGFFIPKKVNGGKIICFPNDSFLYKRFFWRYKGKIEKIQLDRLLKRYRPDFIHLHSIPVFMKETLYAKRTYNTKYVITEHMAPFPFEWMHPLKDIITDVMSEASAVIAVGSAQARQIKNYTGVDCLIIPNVVDDNEFKLFNYSRINQKQLNIVLVGIYEERKGVDYLIPVFSQFLKHHENALLHLVGEADPARIATLTKLVNQYNLSKNIVFHGALTATELCSLYNSCDFYVCASIWESFGVSVLEAQFSGLPVLTTECGGPLDFVDHTNGVVVENNRKEQTLLKGMLQITEQLNHFQREEIAKKAQLRFSARRIKEEYESIYSQLCD